MAALDRREQILARIDAVLVTLAAAETATTAHRNRAGLEGIAGTKLLLLDGDEVVKLSTYGHANPKPPHNLMTLMPEIWVLREPKVNVKNEDVGTEYSEWRVKVLKAIMRDDLILNYCSEEGQIEYLGFDTDLKNENLMLGQMRLDFAFTYVFDPDEL